MTLKGLVIILFIVFIILFIGYRFFRPNEIENEKLEALYFQKLQEFKKGNLSKEEILEFGKSYYLSLKKESSQISELIESDLKSFT